MRRFGLIVGGLAALAVALFLNYYLPTRDVVRIVGTDVVRMDAGPTQGEEAGITRDVRLINAADARGRPLVYRNEDTGWGWPPYFKFDSADLAATAADAVSSEAEPRWMVVTRYGWRVAFLSRFPNAVAIRPATGPDERLIPWFNIAFVATLAAALLLLRRQVLRLFGA